MLQIPASEVSWTGDSGTGLVIVKGQSQSCGDRSPDQQNAARCSPGHTTWTAAAFAATFTALPANDFFINNNRHALDCGRRCGSVAPEQNRLKRLHQESQEKLTEALEKLREQERILERLRTDPAYVEKVIRRRMFYAKPDEYIFRFED